jgi:hypothetical protein
MAIKSQFHTGHTMDVVAVILTVGGLLQLLNSTIGIIDSVRNAPKTALQVSDEIKSILAVNHDFQKALQDQNTRHTARIPADWLEEVHRILRKMLEIAQALQKLAKRGRITWVLKMNATKVCLEQLGRYTLMLGAMEARLSWYVAPGNLSS